MNCSQLIEFARQIPKVELHVHLEGSIRPATLLRLAERNRISLPFSDENGLKEFYRFRNFAHFVETYSLITSCLRTAADYTLVAYEFGEACAEQNIRYAEVTFSIKTNMRHTGLPWQVILSGLNQGREQAKKDFGVHWQWIFDIVRDTPEEQDEVTEIALAGRDQGVIALGLGGNEAKYPPALFQRSFERASMGHATQPGPASIWDALDLLHAERLGHGVRCIEDTRLMERLRQEQIPLEVCPTSNLRLGIYSDYTQHPLRTLWQAGLLITINSDDPPMFGADLNQEYQMLVEHLAFKAKDLEKLSLNALQASFLSAAQKQRLQDEFQAEFTRLRRNLENNPEPKTGAVHDER